MTRKPEKQKLASMRQMCAMFELPKERFEELLKKKILKPEAKDKGEPLFDVVLTVQAYTQYLKKREDEAIMNRGKRTVGEIARLLGCDERWVNRLAKEKNLPKTGHGSYDIEEVVKYRLQMLEHDLEIAKEGGEDAINAKTRLTRAQADLKEMERAERQRDLIKWDDMIKIAQPFVAAIRSKLLGIEKRAHREMGVEVGQYVSKLVESSLTELSEMDLKLNAREGQ